MRILCLLDSQLHAGDRWLWNYLPEAQDDVRFLVTTPMQASRTSRIGMLQRYVHYYRTGHRAVWLSQSERFDLIVAWENKNGLPLLLARWASRKRLPPVVLLTFAVKPALERYRWAINPWLHNNVYYTAPSSWEAAAGMAAFGLSDDQMRVCHLGGYDVLGNPVSGVDGTASMAGEFVFSGGLTGRDYRTLWNAVQGLPIRCVVNAPGKLIRNLPDVANIEKHEILPPEHYFRQLVSARAVVLPLLAHEYAAGLSVVLNAMAAGRPVICTDTPVLREYLQDGVTARLVPAQQPEKLREAIKWVLENRAEADAMGRAARKCYLERFTFEQFALRVHQRLQEIARAA